VRAGSGNGDQKTPAAGPIHNRPSRRSTPVPVHWVGATPRKGPRPTPWRGLGGARGAARPQGRRGWGRWSHRCARCSRAPPYHTHTTLVGKGKHGGGEGLSSQARTAAGGTVCRSDPCLHVCPSAGTTHAPHPFKRAGRVLYVLFPPPCPPMALRQVGNWVTLPGWTWPGRPCLLLPTGACCGQHTAGCGDGWGVLCLVPCIPGDTAAPPSGHMPTCPPSPLAPRRCRPRCTL
jgi:hypothetical protein